MSTANLVTFSGVSLTGTDVDDYTLTVLTQAATITAKALTYSGISVPTSKVYDGTTATLVSGTPVLQGTETGALGSGGDGVPYTGDDVSVTGAPVGTYNSKDVDTANLVTFSGVSLTGTDVDDYTLTVLTQAATITAKALTYTGLTVPSSKTYDGTRTAVVSGTATLPSAETGALGTSADGVPYSGDDVSLTGTPTGIYNAKDVSTANLVTFGGLSILAVDIDDYTLTALTQAATITAKALTYSGISVPTSKVYDGTTATLVSGTPVLQGTETGVLGSGGDGVPYSGDDVSLTGAPVGTYNSKDVSTANLVTFSGVSLTGTDVDDYTLTVLTQAATITAKALTYSGISVPTSKVYDGTTATLVSGTPVLQGTETGALGSGGDGVPYTGDDVSVTGAPVGTYNSKDVDTANLVTFSGVSLTGTDVDDYTLTVLTQAATITAKALTYTGLTVPSSKTYDGTRTAVVSGTATLPSAETGALGTSADGVPYSGDDVSLTGTPTGIYNAKDVSTANLVTFGGLSILAVDIDDYTLTALTQAATITAKALTYSGISVPTSKVYDGTTATLVSGTPVLQGTETGVLGSGGDGVPYSGDDVSLTGARSAPTTARM